MSVSINVKSSGMLYHAVWQMDTKCRGSVAVELRQEQSARSHKRASPQIFFFLEVPVLRLSWDISSLDWGVFHCYLQYLNACVGTAQGKLMEM
jgi:hypothetical protein